MEVKRKDNAIEIKVKEKFDTVGKLHDQKDFSITRQHLYRVVSGEVQTTLKVAKEIAVALNIPLAEVSELLEEAHLGYHGVLQ